jgi:lipopolysaccharide export system permease protein
MPTVSPREMSSRDVYREIRVKTTDLNARINERQSRASSLALALEGTLRTGPASEGWNRRNNQLAAFQREVQVLAALPKDRTLSLYWLEFYKKFSIPFGAFSFIFLAVSLGLKAKKSGQTVGFIFGLIIAVIYWALLLGGQTMGVRLNTPPFWSMWMPNILALSTGLILAVVRVFK